MNSASEHIDDIFRALGSGQCRTPLVSSNTPFMYRSTWQCGCAVDYIDAEVGPFHWSRCADHDRTDDSAPRRSAFDSYRIAAPNA